jgi:hypothetical protein
VRTPDLAAGAFVVSMKVGALTGVFAGPLLGVAIPAAVLLAASVQHVRSRFETPLTRLPAVGFAITLDSAHLLAYFAGRVAGLSWLLRRRRSTAVPREPVSRA